MPNTQADRDRDAATFVSTKAKISAMSEKRAHDFGVGLGREREKIAKLYGKAEDKVLSKQMSSVQDLFFGQRE